ncbi:hypothetical protein PRZ48_003921 [Zasmidium cellare]|uniref:Uncharacterized protein n=1 Tax=Zasmidium cellare TaxID=395010 RepID=A0ABR0EXZ2_ZASCE|nr:hypothetical protein PRZ48_003921 [Zasmidium cellare]
MPPPFHIYREPDYGTPSSRPGGYQTREITPNATLTRRPSHRPISPLGSSRFEREYIPPSMTPSRVAERNAPVGVSSFYSRNLDTPSRRAPPRPRLRGEAEGYGVDLSSLGGGGYGGEGYGGLYRRESASRREPDFSRDPYGGASVRRYPADPYGGSSARRSPANTPGTPFASIPSRRAPSPFNPSSREQYREVTPFDGYDSAAPRGQRHRDGHESSRGYRYY